MKKLLIILLLGFNLNSNAQQSDNIIKITKDITNIYNLLEQDISDKKVDRFSGTIYRVKLKHSLTNLIDAQDESIAIFLYIETHAILSIINKWLKEDLETHNIEQDRYISYTTQIHKCISNLEDEIDAVTYPF